MHRLRSVAAVLAVVTMMCSYHVQGKRAPGDTRPNFVFFLPDETRAESLGTYGHPLTQTPNFDRLAANGTMFEQCHALHTQCSPSRTAMVTGWYMHVLGHRTQTHLVQAYEPNLFRYLKMNGYSVMWYGKNDMLSQDSFNDSVTHWDALIGQSIGENVFEFGEPGYYSFLNTAGDSFGNDSSANADYEAVLRANEFMRNDPPEPFMVFLPGLGAHPSYGAPKDYYHLYDPEDIAATAPLRPVDTPNKPRYQSSTEGIIAYRNLSTLDDEFFYTLNSVYLGRVTYVDWLLGQLLDGVDAAGLTDSTVVIASSDHGDFAGDYHLVEKWPGGLDDILTHVPLIVRMPGGAQGHVVAGQVQLFDLLPTILELANITLNHTQFGVSLVDQLSGAAGNASRVVFSEGGFYYYNEIEAHDPYFQDEVDDPSNLYYPRYQEELSFYPNGSPRAVMIRSLNYKLVYRPFDVSEFYDLSADPRELNNVFGNATYAVEQSQMIMQLLQWYLLTSDVTPLQEDSRNLPPFPGPAPCNPWP